MKYVVAGTDEIGPGDRKIVEVAGRSIGIFNLSGEYYALRNSCPHQGGALCEGLLWGVLKADLPGQFEYEPSREILTCPWHGWEFHVRTGQSWCAPERLRVKRYDVAVVDGEALGVKDDSSPGELPGAAASVSDDSDPDAPAPGLVRGPYVVESYPVTREGQYLVVDL